LPKKKENMQPIKRVLTALIPFELMVIFIAVACGTTTPTATQAVPQPGPTETATLLSSGSGSIVDNMTPEQLCQCEDDVVTNIVFPEQFQYDQTNNGPYFVSEELVWRAHIIYNPATQMCEGEFAFHLCVISVDNLTVCGDMPWQDIYNGGSSVQHTLDNARDFCRPLYP
jgi:hypothetical protein